MSLLQYLEQLRLQEGTLSRLQRIAAISAPDARCNGTKASFPTDGRFAPSSRASARDRCGLLVPCDLWRVGVTFRVTAVLNEPAQFKFQALSRSIRVPQPRNGRQGNRERPSWGRLGYGSSAMSLPRCLVCHDTSVFAKAAPYKSPRRTATCFARGSGGCPISRGRSGDLNSH